MRPPAATARRCGWLWGKAILAAAVTNCFGQIAETAKHSFYGNNCWLGPCWNPSSQHFSLPNADYAVSPPAGVHRASITVFPTPIVRSHPCCWRPFYQADGSPANIKSYTLFIRLPCLGTPAAAGRGREPFGCCSPQPGRAAAAYTGIATIILAVPDRNQQFFCQIGIIFTVSDRFWAKTCQID